MVVLISYDLNKPGKDYSSLYEAIKKTGNWWHYLDSTWLVETNMTTSQIHEQIIKEMDNNDFLLIIRVNKDYQGWLPKEAWEWLNSKIF